jgi:crossover junction endodeoxyribonuclease RuvC
MGVDPGTRITGVGIIDVFPRGEIRPCYYGAVKTNAKASFAFRLKQIYSGLMELMDQYHPDQVALEDIFYSENVKTAIVMGHARGVSLLAPVNFGVEPVEYSPREVKMAVVGNGGATKSQVQFMVQRILNIKEDIQPADAADALAVAICHLNRMKYK